MTVFLTSIFQLILLCGSTAGTRIELFPTKLQDAEAPLAPAPAADGMCETVMNTLGYACEEHKVTTQDGYILSMQRIPVGRSGGASGDRPPVFLQHGLLGNGESWLLLPPEQTLALVLADNGFDVWLANTRGTTYSLGHSSLSPNDQAYWNWSWDELASSDLPAMFKYVYNETGQKLHYVGHSQGTLIALAALSNHQLLDMWKSAALLSPISFLGSVTAKVVTASAEIIMANVSYWLDLGEFNPTGQPAIELIAGVCQEPGMNCSDLLTAFSGQNCCLNSSALIGILTHGPQSTSTRNVIHLAQMITNGTFAMYDYGDENENKKHYGQPTPPAYNLSSIPNDFPLFLGHGGADALSDFKDVKLLLDGLKNHVKNKLEVLFIDNYAHVDFIMGVNAKTVVYDPVMAFLKRN